MLKNSNCADVKSNHDKVRRYFDYDSSRFAENRWLGSDVAREDYNITSEFLLEYLDVRDTDDVLEIGCGPGLWTDLVSRRCRYITAIDISKDMLIQAAKRVQARNVTFQQTDFEEYDDSRTCDKVFSVRVIEYFTDPQQAVKKMCELTKKGGRMVVVTKTAPTLITVRAKLWGFLKRFFLRKGESALEPAISMAKISPFRLRRMFLKCGCKNASIYPVVLRSPLFIHGRYLSPWLGEKFQHKYEMAMLEFFNFLSRHARTASAPVRYLLLIFSETYLITAEKGEVV
jgi:ubiquinone/menaquinone biosynthesis C-methylase UbiE